MSEFGAGLHRISEYCKFKDTLEVMLQDRFVCGIQNRCLQQRLISEADLTFKKAPALIEAIHVHVIAIHVHIIHVQFIEDAKHNSQSKQPDSVLALTKPPRRRPTTTPTKPCYRCGVNISIKSAPSKRLRAIIARKQGTLPKFAEPR